MMAEMSRGEAGEFAPYLAALPTLRATHSPLAWSAAELAELQAGAYTRPLLQLIVSTVSWIRWLTSVCQ